MRKFVGPKLLLVATLSISQLAVVASAQSAPDRRAIVETLDAFFEAFAKRDTTAMWTVTEPGARLVVTSSDANGNPTMRAIPMSDFMKRIAREGPPVREEIWDHQISVHDNLATVWVKYNLYVDDRIDHCGEDSFQMFRSMDGWIIIAIADTQRRTGCAEPQ